MYAVVAVQGHQYIVQQGDEIVVDKMDHKTGDKVRLDDVLLCFDDKGEKVQLGAPYLSGASVEAIVVEHAKGDKIRVVKFQGKKRHHTRRGFTPLKTVLAVEKIAVNGK